MAKLIEITGKSLSGEWGSDDVDGTGIPVLRTTNFTNEGVVNYNDVVTRQISKKNISEKWLRYGDIILEKSGGSDKQPVGRVIFFEGEENKYLFNNFTGLLRVRDTSKWLPKYVFYALFANYLAGATTRYENRTTGLHNLQTDSYIASVEIPDCSMDTQQRIVAHLDKVVELIELQRMQAEKLDMLVKSRFIEMFGNPITNNLLLPTEAMTEICTIIDGDRGSNYPKQEEFAEQGYCLFLNAKNVTATGFSFENCMFITEEKDNALRKGKLERGDVVLTTRGTLGNLAYYDNNVPFDNVRINSGMVILRMKKGIVSEVFFIEQFKLQLQSIKEKIASGSAQPQLPISTMSKIKILIAPMDKQRQFELLVEQIDKSKFEIQQSLEKLETLKKALMQKYFG